MGMWAGIYQGMQDAETSKLAQADLQLKQRNADRLEEEFSENKKLERIKLYADTVGVASAKNTVADKKAATEAAETIATNTLLFENRIESAAQGLSGAEKDSLISFKNIIAKDPNAASKIMSTIKSFEDKGISISAQELPSLFEVVAMTEASGEDTRKTLTELYNLDLNDDALFEELMNSANTYQKAKVVVDFNATKVKGRDEAFLKAQESYMIPVVTVAAQSLIQSLPENNQGRIDLIFQVGKLKDSDEFVRSTAKTYLLEKFLTPEILKSLEESDNPSYRNISKNPLIAPYIGTAKVGTSVVEAPTAPPTQATFPTPDAAAIEKLLSDPAKYRSFYDLTFGPGASDAVLQ